MTTREVLIAARAKIADQSCWCCDAHAKDRQGLAVNTRGVNAVRLVRDWSGERSH